MRRGSLKPTSVRPDQTCDQIKSSLLSTTEQGRKQHDIEEQYKQKIILQSSLIEALRAQISEKPHQCPGCPKFFKRPDHVRSHIRNKHPALARSIDNTTCEKCDKHFTRPIYLRQHNCSPVSCCKYAHLHCKMSILTRFLTASLPPAHSYRCESCRVDLSSSSSLARHMESEKHRQVLRRSTDQDSSLAPKEGASCCRDTVLA